MPVILKSLLLTLQPASQRKFFFFPPLVSVMSCNCADLSCVCWTFSDTVGQEKNTD